MKLIPVTFNICRRYRQLLQSTIQGYTKYILTHHPTERSIMRTINSIIREVYLSLSISFLNVDTSILYVFIISKKNGYHVLERYTKTTSNNKKYSHSILYRNNNYSNFVDRLNKFFSMFVNKYHDSLLYDYHVLSKILYKRKQHPLCIDIRPDQELDNYYEQIHRTMRVNHFLVSFLTLESECNENVPSSLPYPVNYAYMIDW